MRHRGPPGSQRQAGFAASGKARNDWIHHRSQIGVGPNRFELYGSDLAQRGPQGEYFMPAYLLELIDLCRREELAQARLFAMHLDATPWSEIVDAVNQAR